jgi:hypothetical protein
VNLKYSYLSIDGTGMLEFGAMKKIEVKMSRKWASIETSLCSKQVVVY